MNHQNGASERERAKFSAMTEGSAEDWQTIASEFFPYATKVADRVLEHLKLLDGDFGGFPIDRLQHCLQTATRAHRDGRDEQYVVMALLHDIGDTLGSFNHPDVAAAIIKPFVSEKNHWICQNHGIFQGYYYFHYLGMDRDVRDQFAEYESEPLEFFEPMVRRVMAKPLNSIYSGAIDE